MKLTRHLAVLAVAATVALASPSAAVAAPPPPPGSMASLGDSITRGFNACGWYSDCTDKSWSTGADATVNSHYLRIKAVNPAITGKNYNDAVSGAASADLPGQAATAVSQGAGYVTILMGANDACASSEAGMTPTATYRANLDAALAKIKSGTPGAYVYLLSVPDLKRLWQIGKDSGSARFFWSVGGICQSMLANPTSTAAADVARRDRVRQRVVDYNAQLAQACAAYGSQCRFDGNAVFNYPFLFSQVSTWDYFHPNAEGQRVLAQVTYAAGFGW
ncbi:lipoprotein [Longispora fulva]|uniref:Lysophospholipase L1-like esterase n=1 Tax=Longispora fulva TaxID=619741 RepID=A0A8J7GIS6_9ACTN|nr:GDSL-type esterase/lipase family protein [Longispora fulva]MBG6141408.1 lysophospholipase L1-like esterase [Longispora fulva]GIG59442.1 lipoprotein [Longispora fulva]